MMLTDLTIAQARAGLRARDFSAEDLTLAHLHAIDALNPRLNAYITVSHALAMDQAHAADAALARGEARALTERKGAPLLTMVRVAYDDQGRAAEYGNHIYRASRYSFDLTLTGW